MTHTSFEQLLLLLLLVIILVSSEYINSHSQRFSIICNTGFLIMSYCRNVPSSTSKQCETMLSSLECNIRSLTWHNYSVTVIIHAGTLLLITLVVGMGIAGLVKCVLLWSNLTDHGHCTSSLLSVHHCCVSTTCSWWCSCGSNAH